ncbi:eukaryotic translation initiation factor 3 [Dacryopinax primogenitus]|uniref:Eukaryotic translation initiation factor 3 subunit G n=1 Tax=Dacryopinax primogenitus (strain DJM 731) TaxID=1858805 RepID=M5FQP3_DACPD|nr:eukaryotic translation initiation factor 3 [Dacryopinax primogenitus]EJT99240.1 eukaryotic translation initiation factor 3 [Dacryopinax primogenitus]
MATTTEIIGKSWADDVDEPIIQHPRVEETVDENGIYTVVEYTTNEEGKKIKITRKIRKMLKTSVVDHAVAERKHWTKFGIEKGNKAGPDRATTTVSEPIELKLQAGGVKQAEPEQDDAAAMKAKLGNKKVVCRICQGDHFTARCPYKETLEPMGLGAPGAETPMDGADTPQNEPAAAAPTTGGKYVPPSMRAGASRGGESMYKAGGSREDMPTLRVTNLSEDAEEDDLRDLFQRFGRVARVFIGRDRETGVGKGYAFVSFEDRDSAQRALDRVHGMGYANLILSVQWSVPREQRAGA